MILMIDQLAHVFILRKLTHLKACVNGNTLKFTCTQYLVHEQKLFKFFFLHFPDCMEPMYLFEQKSDTLASRPKNLVPSEPPVGFPPPFFTYLLTKFFRLSPSPFPFFSSMSGKVTLHVFSPPFFRTGDQISRNAGKICPYFRGKVCHCHVFS